MKQFAFSPLACLLALAVARPNCTNAGPPVIEDNVLYPYVWKTLKLQPKFDEDGKPIELDRSRWNEDLLERACKKEIFKHHFSAKHESNYTVEVSPPKCDPRMKGEFTHVVMKQEITSGGGWVGQIAVLSMGPMNIWITEGNGKRWDEKTTRTIWKDMTPYACLLHNKQNLTMDLPKDLPGPLQGNFDITLTAYYLHYAGWMPPGPDPYIGTPLEHSLAAGKIPLPQKTPVPFGKPSANFTPPEDKPGRHTGVWPRPPTKEVAEEAAELANNTDPSTSMVAGEHNSRPMSPVEKTLRNPFWEEGDEGEALTSGIKGLYKFFGLQVTTDKVDVGDYEADGPADE
ncbi:hypothetical protein G7046_g7873 [Stylonectria norvegica]|nr:hypothetical protein G7046_g7873 [Stylonectria norvegica]